MPRSAGVWAAGLRPGTQQMMKASYDCGRLAPQDPPQTTDSLLLNVAHSQLPGWGTTPAGPTHPAAPPAMAWLPAPTFLRGRGAV